MANIILETKEMAAGSYLAVQSMIAKLFRIMLDPAMYQHRQIAVGGEIRMNIYFHRFR